MRIERISYNGESKRMFYILWKCVNNKNIWIIKINWQIQIFDKKNWTGKSKTLIE